MAISDEQYRKFAKVTFDDFRKLAQDDSLSKYEKVGGPNSYLEGKKEIIFQNVTANLPLLKERERVVLDIGPGCADMAEMVIGCCREQGHTLLLVDSQEMLDYLPNDNFIQKFAARFPHCEPLFEKYASKVDAILVYSVLHCVFIDGNVWDFLDRALELLAEGGQMLIGDIPNVSKRRRFFSSANGVRFHKDFMKTEDPPEVHFNRVERHLIDDSVIMGLVGRARSQGFDAYVVPQPSGLPMANRREDVLIRRP